MPNPWEQPKKVIEKDTNYLITLDDLSMLDPENGESDLASVVYLSVKMMHEEGYFTKESLIDFLATKAGGKKNSLNPNYRSRAEKTVNNFLSRGYLVENAEGGLVAKFDITK